MSGQWRTWGEGVDNDMWAVRRTPLDDLEKGAMSMPPEFYPKNPKPLAKR